MIIPAQSGGTYNEKEKNILFNDDFIIVITWCDNRSYPSKSCQHSNNIYPASWYCISKRPS